MNPMKNNREFVVLVVEDSIEISNLITLYLEENYAVLHASTGREAISVVEENSVDLIILDLMLPHMNGYEVMKEIRKKRNTPIIIVSAKNTDEEKIIGLQKGADDYITKPFNPLELSARVEANIRRFYKFGSAEVTCICIFWLITIYFVLAIATKFKTFVCVAIYMILYIAMNLISYVSGLKYISPLYYITDFTGNNTAMLRHMGAFILYFVCVSLILTYVGTRRLEKIDL